MWMIYSLLFVRESESEWVNGKEETILSMKRMVENICSAWSAKELVRILGKLVGDSLIGVAMVGDRSYHIWLKDIRYVICSMWNTVCEIQCVICSDVCEIYLAWTTHWMSLSHSHCIVPMLSLRPTLLWTLSSRQYKRLILMTCGWHSFYITPSVS